ncbi:MAG: hypothetical protein IJM79_08195 [Erysipelotrichaceae bacterium]|nr:hypothetical protein [Erysipelotrichaceae bacterium]
MKNKLLFVIAALWQLSYGIIQSAIGALVFLFFIRCPHFIYRCGIITEWTRCDGVSLGLFAFVPHGPNKEVREHLVRHEYGHSIQSMILGPLYLPLIGIPSVLWNNLKFMQNYRENREIAYESFYTERWANRLGKTENMM